MWVKSRLVGVLGIGILLGACSSQTAKGEFRGGWYAVYEGGGKEFVLAIVNETEKVVQVLDLKMNDGWDYAFADENSRFKAGEIRIIRFRALKNAEGEELRPSSCVLPVSVVLRGAGGSVYPIELPSPLPISIPQEYYAACRVDGGRLTTNPGTR